MLGYSHSVVVMIRSVGLSACPRARSMREGTREVTPIRLNIHGTRGMTHRAHAQTGMVRKAGDRIRTGDVQLGRLSLYH